MIRINKKLLTILFLGIFWINLMVQPVYARQPQVNIIKEEEIDDFRENMKQFTGEKSLDEMLREEDHGEIEFKFEKKETKSNLNHRVKEFFKDTKDGFIRESVQFVKNNFFWLLIIMALYTTLKIREIKQQKRGE